MQSDSWEQELMCILPHVKVFKAQLVVIRTTSFHAIRF